ncbi:MAG: hypothetical protein KDD33_11065 [Bdellovibrionales bacterium]|nr:hypothetical protein [Bdellovibrionales bacterium]
MANSTEIKVIEPGHFRPDAHYYQKVVNAQIHPLIKFFLGLSKQQIVSRYCHLNPQADPEMLMERLCYQAKHLRWSGADLFYVTTAQGQHKIVVVEVNSCPSGQKSMPLRDDAHEAGGYEAVLRHSFLNKLKGKRMAKGELAVIFDKNPMEASGYAATLADLTGEKVYLIPFYQKSWDENCRYNEDKVLQFQWKGEWKSVRAAFRYVTQKPWNRIPVDCKTQIFNPVIGCLAGGRNKLVAAKAYELFNADLAGDGLKINIPHTIYDVDKMEIPMIIQSLGGRGVVKIPYSNAGQGVFTITNSKELNDFMEREDSYDRYIVQGLIGNSSWSSRSPDGELYHVGTMPNKKNHIYVADIRFMVASGEDGFLPICLYARKAREPLQDHLDEAADSWSMLGTNLSKKMGEDKWDSETERLILMDTRDFNKLGIGIDQLIEGYVQTVLAVTAIDKLAIQLINDKGRLKRKLFRSLNKDEAYIGELFNPWGTTSV